MVIAIFNAAGGVTRLSRMDSTYYNLMAGQNHGYSQITRGAIALTLGEEDMLLSMSLRMVFRVIRILSCP